MTVDFSGNVFVCGDNSFRQLGIQHSDKLLSLKPVPNFFQKTLKVAAGNEHSLILTQEGEVYAAGNNINGNLGLGHNFSSDSFLQVHGLQNLVFATISAGRHSAAITNDNRLFVWGPVFMNENALILP
jgi:alpha-tubulin suppressor-like RCC1 family protein